MKIVICGSITASDKLIEIAKKLQAMGHSTDLPYYTKKILAGEFDLEKFKKEKEKNGDISFRRNASEDLIKRYYRLISESDAILIVNVDKNNIKNYIGGNAFLEMGFAYCLDKKIYLLNPIPEMPYIDELKAMAPIVLNNNLELIV